jgi:hypothetical protein
MRVGSGGTEHKPYWALPLASVYTDAQVEGPKVLPLMMAKASIKAVQSQETILSFPNKEKGPQRTSTNPSTRVWFLIHHSWDSGASPNQPSKECHAAGTEAVSNNRTKKKQETANWESHSTGKGPDSIWDKWRSQDAGMLTLWAAGWPLELHQGAACVKWRDQTGRQDLWSLGQQPHHLLPKMQICKCTSCSWPRNSGVCPGVAPMWVSLPLQWSPGSKALWSHYNGVCFFSDKQDSPTLIKHWIKAFSDNAFAPPHIIHEDTGVTCLPAPRATSCRAGRTLGPLLPMWVPPTSLSFQWWVCVPNSFKSSSNTEGLFFCLANLSSLN